MTEGLFILTTIFVAYIVYAIIDEQKTTAKSKAPAAKPEAQAAAVKQEKSQVAVAKEKTAATKPAAAKAVKTAPPKTVATKAAAAKPAATKAAVPAPKTTAAPKAAAKPAATKAKPAAAKKATAAVSAPSAGLKDPKTGEVATAYSNYRFTKRWIKDALVAEGLLDKVYTANELNAATEAKIKTAIAKLEAMSKYKA